MVSELHTVTDVIARGAHGTWIAEFGFLSNKHLSPSKQYCGRLYRLTPESLKIVSDAVGFTARFELPAIRTACMDLFKTEGEMVFEIERNTKPLDVSVRYARDRWNVQEVIGKSEQGLRPWIKTEYRARFLADKIMSAIASELKVKPEDIINGLVRINFKERTFGLVIEERFIESCPPNAYMSFELPAIATSSEQSSEVALVIAVPTEQAQVPETETSDSNVSMQETEQAQPAPSNELTEPEPVAIKAQRTYTPPSREIMESQPKYATYSRSEVDQLLKQQAEVITSAIGSKISAQQRAITEAIASQEKSFTRLSETFINQFEQARARLEKSTQTTQSTTASELAEFQKQLTRELEQFRTQINKAVQPLAKISEEKPPKQAKDQKPASAATQRSSKDPVVITLLVAVLIAVAASTFVLYNSLTSISNSPAVQQKINELQKQVSLPPATTKNP